MKPTSYKVILLFAELLAGCLNQRCADASEPTAAITIIPNGPFRSGASYEVLTYDGLRGQGERKDNWHADQCLGIEWRASEQDYAKSEFDKFHHAPAGDFTYQTDIDKTFSLSNCSPGNRTLNRGFWRSQIEGTVDAMRRMDNKLTVFTTPLYLPGDDGRLDLQTIGANHVVVPTHYAKCVLEERPGHSPHMIAWVLPNVEPPDGALKEDYQRSVDYVEERCAFDVFDWLDPKVQKNLESGR